jgi:hypothetical protein
MHTLNFERTKEAAICCQFPDHTSMLGLPYAACAGMFTSAAASASTSGKFYDNSSSSSSGGDGTSSIASSSRRAANAPLAAPWTPTSMLIKRKTYQKRSRFLIQVCGQISK